MASSRKFVRDFVVVGDDGVARLVNVFSESEELVSNDGQRRSVEVAHTMETTTGRPVICDADGTYYVTADNGRLVLCRLKPGPETPRS